MTIARNRVRAAVADSAAVTYRDPNKNVVNDLLFRTSPGSISSKASPFTHALIQFLGKPELEAHIGIKIQGKSVCRTNAMSSSFLRRKRTPVVRQHPSRHSSVVISAECKYYYSNLPFRLSREFLDCARRCARWTAILPLTLQRKR